MVKKIIATFFVLAFLAQSFSSSIIVAAYQINNNLFAKNCINKAKPKLRCNGKCQMRKKMQQAEKNDNQENSSISIISFLQIISSKSFFAHTAPACLVAVAKNVFYIQNDNATVDRARHIFRPPII